MRVEVKIALTKEDLEACYLLRYNILRKPWNQPRGGEKDNLEEYSTTWMAIKNDKIIGTLRLNGFKTNQLQLRFMAIELEYQKKGLGLLMLNKIENHVQNHNPEINSIILNSRENAVPLYLKWGAVISGLGDTLFGEIKHFKMIKEISQ